MPKEPITCPSCGSPEAVERGPHSFVCKHCGITFRWVDPTQFTVEHKGAICSCGRHATANCKRCGASLCKKHQRKWQADYWRYVGYHWEGREQTVPASRQHLTELAEPLLQRLEAWNYAHHDILCSNCVKDCNKQLAAAYPEITAIVGSAVAEGRICASCLTSDIAGSCSLCRRMVCSEHVRRCAECGRLLCPEHQLSCSKCSRGFCAQHYNARRSMCQACRRIEKTEKVVRLLGLAFATLIFGGGLLLSVLMWVMKRWGKGFRIWASMMFALLLCQAVSKIYEHWRITFWTRRKGKDHDK